MHLIQFGDSSIAWYQAPCTDVPLLLLDHLSWVFHKRGGHQGRLQSCKLGLCQLLADLAATERPGLLTWLPPPLALVIALASRVSTLQPSVAQGLVRLRDFVDGHRDELLA